MHPPGSPHNHPMRGIALRVAAGFSFSMMVALLKLASGQGAGLAELIAYRSGVGALVVVLWVLPREGVDGLVPRRPSAVMTRNALGIIGMLASFEALVLLPLAEATTLGFTGPIIATLLSGLILRERIGPWRLAAVMVAFLGVIVVMRPGAGAQDSIAPIGVMMAMVAAFFSAIVTIALRNMAGTESVGAITFWFQIGSCLIGLILIPAFGATAAMPTIVLMLIAGLFGGFGQIWLTASLHAAPVPVLTPFDYLQIITSALLGWLLIGTQPTVYTWIGAVLIGGSGLFTLWRERRLHLQRESMPIQPLP